MLNFNFNTDIILEDEFVLLRPLEINDYQNLLHFALEEPEIWTYSLVPANGEQGMKNYIAAAINAREEQKEYAFIVFDKMQHKYAGSTRFYDIQLAHHTLQLGYTWYGKSHQGTGLNKHCKFLLLQFAFEKMGMNRVEFRADENNAKSIAAMKSIGCQVEGILRNHLIKEDGQRRSSIVLSILASEWSTNVKTSLQNKLKLSLR